MKVGGFVKRKKLETGLIVVKNTKFDNIRRKILMFFYGKDYKILENYQQLLKNKKPQKKDIIIPKEIKLEKD